jgi:hypothetical protein
VKDLIDEIISEEFSSPDLELHWLDEDADAAGLEASLEGRVKLGAFTLNEMRDHLGLDPYANPAADRPMVLTPNGYVPIEANAGGNGNASENTNGQPAPAVQKYSPTQPRVPAGNPDGGQWTNEDESPAVTDVRAESVSGPRVRYAALETRTQTDASRAPAGVQYASTAPPDISRALTGDSRIDDVTKKLAQIYADTIDELARLPGQPQKYGIIVHLAFAAAVIEAGIREPMDVERSFDLPPGFPSSKQSVRPDVVLWNYSGDIVAIYDIKTGDRGVDPWRARELRAATGAGPDVPIIVMYTDKAILKNRMI